MNFLKKIKGLDNHVFIWLFTITFLGSTVLPVTGFGEPTDQQYTIELKSRTFTPTPGSQVAALEEIPLGDSYHVMMQFYELPNETQRQSLAATGILLLEYIPQNTWIVSIKPSQLMSESQTNLNIRWSGKLLPSDKVSPDILGNTFGE